MQGVSSIQLMLSEDGGDGSTGSETPEDVEAPEEDEQEGGPISCGESFQPEDMGVGDGSLASEMSDDSVQEAPEEDQQASPQEAQEEGVDEAPKGEQEAAGGESDATLQAEEVECPSQVDQEIGIGEGGQAEAADTLSESADTVATAAASVAAAQEATP